MKDCLTEEQLQVVNSNHPFIVCSACPGSGKTRVIIERAKRISSGCPRKTLITSFTKKGRTEIKERLKGFEDNIETFTIHSLAFHVIRENWAELNSLIRSSDWPDKPLFMSEETEQTLLLEEFGDREGKRKIGNLDYCRRMGITGHELLSLRELGVFFGKKKPEDFREFDSYEQYRIQRGVLMYHDLIPLAIRLVKAPETSLEFYSHYSNLLIDEAQDLSLTHWRFLEPFLFGVDSVTLAGDLNQSIFSYAQGNGMVMEKLKNLKSSKHLTLTLNFRSGKRIVEACNKVIKSEEMTAAVDLPGIVITKGFETFEEEKSFLQDWYTEGSAILFRTNAGGEKYLEIGDGFTIHSSKGREWDRVAIVSADPTQIPHPLNRKIEEERNLFYVACSRAKKELLITYVGQPSLFVTELEEFLGRVSC